MHERLIELIMERGRIKKRWVMEGGGMNEGRMMEEGMNEG